MSKTILVPLDGSELAERALPYACALARPMKGRLLLLHAVPAGSRSEQSGLEDDPYTYLESRADRVRAEGLEAVPRVEYIYYWEEAARAIRDVAAERQADLIVMSSHGRSGMGRWLWGSVSDLIMRTATMPVLLVPAAGDFAWPTDRAPRILVPLDGSPLAEQVLGPAAELAESLGAELHLLRAGVPLNYAYLMYGQAFPTASFYDQEVEEGEVRRYLEGIAGALRTAGKSVTVHTGIGVPAVTIALVADEQGVDMIAMTTHGRSGLARLVLGSVASATLQHATVPLLLVRPTQIPEQTAAPEPPAVTTQPLREVTAPLALSPRELDLVYRGLGELLYTPSRDPRLVEPLRDLMAKVKGVEPAAANAQAVSAET